MQLSEAECYACSDRETLSRWRRSPGPDAVHDSWYAERELAQEIKKIPTLKPAAA